MMQAANAGGVLLERCVLPHQQLGLLAATKDKTALARRLAVHEEQCSTRAPHFCVQAATASAMLLQQCLLPPSGCCTCNRCVLIHQPRTKTCVHMCQWTAQVRAVLGCLDGSCSTAGASSFALEKEYAAMVHHAPSSWLLQTYEDVLLPVLQAASDKHGVHA
jgi:hypothetical protein